MKFTLRGASSAAILVGLGGALPVFAQEAAPAPQVDQAAPQAAAEQTPQDRVVITGSFIAGSSEAAALPVEVFSAAELEEQGAPTALEFAKTLTIAGPTTGEAYYFSGAALTGSVNFNLRGLGADKTLTLLNGRRGSENTSNIPAAALARTEVLKDGAAVIYGADATGGVVNFITRDNFTGLEARASYKYIDGSDGDYSVSLLGGVGEGDTNFMWSAEWEHRSRLETEDRDFATASFNFLVNPAPWSTLTNLAGWTPRGALPPTPTLANEFGTALAAPISDFSPASCAAVGGFYVNTFTCNYNYISYYNLVEENDIFRGYAQLNTAVSDNMDFHFEASYGQVLSPQVFGSPAQPVIRGPAMATGAVNQFYVPITNPFAAAFAARTGAPAGAQGFTPTTYRAFAHGGNPVFGQGNGYGVPSKIDNQVWRVSAGLKGVLGDWAGIFKEVGYDAALTYNQSISYADAADILGFRLQEALNGFGGPACSAPDLDPARFGTQNPAAAGKGACQWWNPFATNFPNQPERGLTNPQYVAGQENSLELARWLFDDRASEDINSSLTADLVFNGMSGINLPGGEVGWALGGQVRQLELREVVNSPLYNGNLQCDWPTSTTGGSPAVPQTPRPTTDPLFRGCTPDNPGPFVFFGINPPDYNDQQQYSLFGELQIPLLDTLNFQAAVRREEFSGGLGATVYKVSGKWDVFGPLSLRGSYGTNYQAPPVGVIPGEINNAVRSYTLAGGNWLGAQFITDSSLVPETATAWNVGAIWQSQGFAPEHDFRFIIDYFNIETEDEIGQLADPNQILALVYNGPVLVTNGGPTITTCDPNVQPLIRRVTFNAGCSIGLGANQNSFSSISTVFGNGPGQTTNGIDYQVTYEMPVGPGDLTLNLTATQVTELLTGPTSLDGVVVSTGDDRLGTLNFATVASAAPEWRANFSANYKMDSHNFRLGANFVSAVTDERAGIQYGETGEEWLTYDLTYLFDITETMRLTASVNNITDKDPPPAQEELGYDPRLGNPLGRTFEIGIKKTF